jgi:H/ACA ribonucleoprotein complex subunit 4
MVTGVLPLALEDATKTIGAFLLTGKEYVCLMTMHGDVDETRLRGVLGEFVGEIFQKPPVRAAVKREIRKRTIYSIEDVEVEGRQVLFRVACQAGTYIRKLVYDIGEVLEVGAHMRELRRTRSGSFTEKDILSLYDVLKLSQSSGEERDAMVRKIVRPMEDAFDYVPRVYIRDSAVSSICHGADLAVPGVVKLSEGIRPKTAIALFTLKGELVALSRALIGTEQILRDERGLAAKTVRVIMPTETYPRLWKPKHRQATVTQFSGST